MAGILLCDCICGTADLPCGWCQENTAPVEYELEFAGVTPVAFLNNFAGGGWGSVKPIGTLNGIYRLPRATPQPMPAPCTWTFINLLLQLQVWSGANATGTLLCTSTLGATITHSVQGGPNPPSDVQFIAGRVQVNQISTQDPCLGQFSFGGNLVWFDQGYFISTTHEPGVCDTERTLTNNSHNQQNPIATGGTVIIRRAPPSSAPAPNPDDLIDAMGYTLDSARDDLLRPGCCDPPQP
jgi:hypothetical protein